MPQLTPAARRHLFALTLLLALGSTWWTFADLAAREDKAPIKPAFLVRPYLQLPTPTSMTVMWETNQKLPGRVEYGLTSDLGKFVEIDKESVLHEIQLPGLKPGTTYHYRVRSGDLVSDTYHFKTAPLPGTKRWRMAVYGDSRSYPAIHAKVAQQIAKANVDLIVHTGDIVVDGRNHDSWRKEFFEPLAPLAGSVPWVSTIGNHERDSENYFSYVALPGNERYFGFDFANAHIVCLDSNAWIEKGRDSKQGQWLAEHLAGRRDATWTFVVFHHPLFSAHATRPINPLRWDWAPVFLDPANCVDGVLTGHDHFYARNYRMGRLSDKPQPGVFFLTTAGGAASLYKVKERDYVAREKSVHHFTLFDFDDDEVVVTPIDVTGRGFDRYVLTKKPTPPDEFCAYEVEEVRRFLRLALAAAPPVKVAEKGPTPIDTVLSVPTRFAVPVAGQLEWAEAKGWKIKQPAVDFKLEPGQMLKVPLQAEVAAGAFACNPRLTITFEEGRFRNRKLELYPFQLGGPERITVRSVDKAPVVDGKLDDPVWREGEGHSLLGLPYPGGRGDRVQLAADRDYFYLGARLDDPKGLVEVKPAASDDEGSRTVLYGEHVGLMLSDGKQTHRFAVTPEHLRFHENEDDEEVVAWKAAVARTEGAWTVEMAVPRGLFPDWSKVRVNVTHRRGEGKDSRDLHLCPTYTFGTDPDRITDVKPAEGTERFARLVME